jgi:hypothetical protein
MRLALSSVEKIYYLLLSGARDLEQGVVDHLRQFLRVALDDGRDQRLLAREVLVEPSDANAGHGCDLWCSPERSLPGISKECADGHLLPRISKISRTVPIVADPSNFESVEFPVSNPERAFLIDRGDGS